jgi:hypothetical protein
MLKSNSTCNIHNSFSKELYKVLKHTKSCESLKKDLIIYPVGNDLSYYDKLITDKESRSMIKIYDFEGNEEVVVSLEKK